MTIIDLADLRRFDRRNIWQPDRHTLESRPGLKRMLEPGFKIVGARSIKSATSGETHHYIVLFDDAGATTKIRRYDENFLVFTSLDLPVRREPRIVTFAPLGQEMLISSPDFAPVRAVVGGHMEVAGAVDSDNERNTATIDYLPPGIAESWKNRVVVAAQPTQDSASALFFSDPMKPRTFAAQNFLPGPWASPVHGLHVCPAGLVVMAETGAWLVPDAVVTSGQLIDRNVKIEQLSGHQTWEFGHSCSAQGQVFGLTRRGVRRVYPPSDDEVPLSEKKIPRGLWARQHAEDWRMSARMVGGHLGPMVVEGFELWWLDLSTGHRGWWNRNSTSGSPYHLRAVGILHEPTGEELLCTEQAVYRLQGNTDGDNAGNEDLDGSPKAVVSGALPTDASFSHNLKRLAFKAWAQNPPAQNGFLLYVNGQAQVSGSIPQRGAVEGVADWDTGVTTMRDALLGQIRTKPARGDGAHFEVAFEFAIGHLAGRIHTTVDVEDSGQSKARDKRNP